MARPKIDLSGLREQLSGFMPKRSANIPPETLIENIGSLGSQLEKPDLSRLGEDAGVDIFRAMHGILHRLKRALAEKEDASTAMHKTLSELSQVVSRNEELSGKLRDSQVSSSFHKSRIESLNREIKQLQGSLWQWRVFGCCNLILAAVSGMVLLKDEYDAQRVSEKLPTAEVIAKELCDYGVSGKFSARKGSRFTGAGMDEVIEPSDEKDRYTRRGGFNGDFSCDPKDGVLPSNLAGVYEEGETALHLVDGQELLFEPDASYNLSGRVATPRELRLSEEAPFVWLVFSSDIPVQDQWTEIIYEIAGNDGTVSSGFVDSLKNLNREPYAKHLYILSEAGSREEEMMPLSTFLTGK